MADIELHRVHGLGLKAARTAADRMAEERISAIGKLRLPHLGAPAPRFQGRRGN